MITMSKIGISTVSETIIALILLVGLPSILKAQTPAKEPSEADQRTQTIANIRQITRAMHQYHQKEGCYPPRAIYDPDQKPLLSWRVLLLPYLGEKKLYDQFNQEEPWDGPNNKKLLKSIPSFYKPVRATKEGHETFYQVFSGSEAVFLDGRRITARMLSDFDGNSNTLLLAEAADPVPWSKPADMEFDPKKAPPKLSTFFKDGRYAALCDGTIILINKNIPEPNLKELIGWRDGGSRDVNPYVRTVE